MPSRHHQLAVAVCCGTLGLSGCGSGGDGNDSATGSGGGTAGDTSADTSGTTGGDGSPSGRSLFFMSIHSLVGVDTGSHDETLSLTVTQDMTDVRDIDITADQVWLAREDGVVIAVDREQQAIADQVDMQSLGADEDEPVTASHVAIGDDFAYTTAESFGLHAVVAIDKSSFDMTVNTDALSSSSYTSGILYDGSHVWVITGASDNLYKLDPITLEPVGTLDFSEVLPNEPDAEGSWGGDTHIAHVGDSIWVVDSGNPRLLQVDRDSLEVSVVDDLADVSHMDDYFEFATNGSDVFLMLAGQDVVLRFDGDTGERSMQYDFADRGGSERMTVNDQNLYVRDDPIFPATFLEVDLRTGQTLQQIQPGTASYPLAVD